MMLSAWIKIPARTLSPVTSDESSRPESLEFATNGLHGVSWSLTKIPWSVRHNAMYFL